MIGFGISRPAFGSVFFPYMPSQLQYLFRLPHASPLGVFLPQVKLQHWDPAIRHLASLALHNLTEVGPAYMVEEVLPALLRQTLSPDLLKRHGSLLGIAEILLGLARYPYPITPALVQDITQVGGR